jgi:hypothetical protein
MSTATLKISTYETYTAPFHRWDMEPEIRTHCLSSKKIPAVALTDDDSLDDEGNITTTPKRIGQKTPTVQLRDMLLTQWPKDVHYSMYWTSEQKRQQKSDPSIPPLDIEFAFAAFDLDFDEHKSLPTINNFSHLTRTLTIIDHTPNIVYTTRGGARIIYLIDPITDAATFEGHYQQLFKKIRLPLNKSANGYKVDEIKDWTRLFRAPLVIRDDKPEYHHLVRIYHAEILDIRQFKIKKRKTERVWGNGNQHFNQGDAYLQGRLREIEPGNRNNALFRAACHALRVYTPDAAQTWLDVFRNRAHAEGLSPTEIEAVIHSAEHTINKGPRK